MDLTLTLPLPLDQFRFNLVLWILITAYWASGIWNFLAFIPECSDEDAEMLWYKRSSNYSFRLISSLIFFLLWISQFRFLSLIYLTMGEIYLTVIIYFWIIIRNLHYTKENRKKKKEITKRNNSEIK